MSNPRPMPRLPPAPRRFDIDRFCINALNLCNHILMICLFCFQELSLKVIKLTSESPPEKVVERWHSVNKMKYTLNLHIG